MQRHHLLPRQLLSQQALASLFEELGCDRLGFDDFRLNGLLLPSEDSSARMLGLPLHRGPHRAYNEMVTERVGQIEAGWAAHRLLCGESAANEAMMRFGLLQRGLRRRLLDASRRPFPLNKCDPLGAGIDFAELDAMADALWKATPVPPAPVQA